MPLSGHSQVSFTRYPGAFRAKDAGIPSDVKDEIAGSYEPAEIEKCREMVNLSRYGYILLDSWLL
jgi:hypothetical protein